MLNIHPGMVLKALGNVSTMVGSKPSISKSKSDVTAQKGESIEYVKETKDGE